MNNVAPILESERLKLIPLCSANHLSEEYLTWMNDEDVIQHLESGGNYTYVKLKQFLEKLDSNPILFWAIHIKETNKHIGNIKIDPIDEKHRYGEYGILMGDKEEWGKGFAKEASIQVIKYCFSAAINLRKINLGVRSKNTSAFYLYKSIGFEIEGCLKKHVITKDGLDDVFRMAIFNSNENK
jgi:ribosomal-protein-alanine N-acetyltransferase